MTHSTMLQLKISKTKKRLSNNFWSLPLVTIALMGLCLFLSFHLRSISIASLYGIIPVEIPIVSHPIDDPTFHQFRETPNVEIKGNTPIVALTKEAFYFGDLQSFSADLAGVRNKFLVRHVDGAPDTPTLLSQLKRWGYTRMSEKKINSKGLLIFMPAEDIPVPILVQTIANLKKSSLFSRIVLAGGIQ